MTTTVYALSDPRVGTTRYIGQSGNPGNRLKQHISEARRGKSRSRKNQWVSSLLDAGVRPVMSIVYEGPNYKANELEEALINSLPDLTNSAMTVNPPSGWALSKIRKAQIAENNRVRRAMSAAGRANIAAANRKRLGEQRGEMPTEQRQRISVTTMTNEEDLVRRAMWATHLNKRKVPCSICGRLVSMPNCRRHARTHDGTS